MTNEDDDDDCHIPNAQGHFYIYMYVQRSNKKGQFNTRYVSLCTPSNARPLRHLGGEDFNQRYHGHHFVAEFRHKHKKDLTQSKPAQPFSAT